MDDLLLCQPSKNNTDVLAGLSRKTTTDYDDSTTLYSQVRVYWVGRGAFMLTGFFCAFGQSCSPLHSPACFILILCRWKRMLASRSAKPEKCTTQLLFCPLKKVPSRRTNSAVMCTLSWSDSPSQDLNLPVTLWPEQLSDWSHGSEVVWPCSLQSDLSCLTGLTFRTNP